MGEEVEWTINYFKSSPNASVEYGRDEDANIFLNSIAKSQLSDGSGIIMRNPQSASSVDRMMFRNGGFTYIDIGSLVETNTPECRNHYELVRYNRAMEIYMYLASVEYSRGREIYEKERRNANVWKSNVDAKMVSRGVHESYDTDARKFIDKIDLMMPYLVFRQLFAGSGGYYGNEYVISPRAMITGVPKNSSSQSNSRPILNEKNENLSTESRFRFHQTLGDGLRGDVPNLLKYGITSYMIAAVEEGIVKDAPVMEDPVNSIKKISKDLNGNWGVELKNGKKMKALEYLYSDVLESIEKLFRNREVKSYDKLTLDKYKFVLDKLYCGLFESLRSDVEWLNKKYFVDKYYESMEFPNNYTELQKKKSSSFAYTDVANDTVWLNIRNGINFGFFRNLRKNLRPLRTTRIWEDEDVKLAVLLPPQNSRAEFRAWLVKKHGNNFHVFDWQKAERHAGNLNYSIEFLELDGWCPEKYEEADKRWKSQTFFYGGQMQLPDSI